MLATRRSFTGGAASLIILEAGSVLFANLPPASAQAAAEEEVSFRWRVPIAHFQTVEDSLTFQGSIEEERDTKGPLVFILIGVALLPSLADAVLTLRRKLVQPGLRIDTRGTEIQINVDPTLPRGMILLVDRSGAKLYEPDQLADSAELAKALATAVGK
jgi:hypothetical protein